MRTICIALLTLFLASSCIPARPKAGAQVPARQVRTEKPALTVTKISSAEIIIDYEGFTVSYNPQRRIPNWVFYELIAEETNGPYSRKGKNFQQDSRSQVPQSDSYDFRGSGWSRGHMAPAADFKWSDSAMWETFYYTNICPQDRGLNNRYWNTLENKVRSWAKQFGKVYVVTGPIIGKNVNGVIGSHGVTIPDAFFKAILAPLADGWTSIAFMMENTSDQRYFKDCATTVNVVEKMTGFDFFSSLDDSVEESIEDLLDYKTWRVY